MKSAYLTHSILSIFDKIEDLDDNYFKIINGLKSSMYRTNVPQSKRVVLDSGNLNISTLKDVLGNLVPDKIYNNFVSVCRKEMNLPESDEEEKYDNEMASNRNKIEEEPLVKTIIKFTNDFWVMLDKVKPANDVVWAIYSLDSNTSIKNGLGIEKVDVSNKQWYFDIVQNGKPGKIKITQFIKYYFGNSFLQDDIMKFVNSYNKLIGGVSDRRSSGDTIKPREFKYEPKNVRDTFISLVTETYPMGHEDEVVQFLPDGLERDQYGNYYLVIGESDTVFTSHLDTVSRNKTNVGLVGYKKDGQDFIKTDGRSILGADDKSGVAILMYMIAHGIPGVYWFFYGEERGGIGSGKVANDMESYPFMQNKKKMISFDRRNYFSIITQQMGVQCCSNEFGESLCNELNKSGLSLNLDTTGVFTDSANFIDLIPECTNVSVGYFNEHTHDELQNITYLEALAKACVAVNWDNLVVRRKIGFDEEITRKYNRLMKDFKRMTFWNEDSMSGVDGKLIIDIEVSDRDLGHLYRDLTDIQKLFAENKVDPDIIFDEDHIKIELD